MPLPLLAAVAAPAATLWNYNRANFLYDSGQKVTRTYTSISYKMQQFQLYRQDIRDLVALTTEKMANYHVVACLELGMTATMLGPARLPDDTPEWILWHQLVSLCSAFVFLVTSMWLATRAAVAAGSFNVRLQTQYIRLPLPDDEQLDSALTKAEDFEGVELTNILRLPFLTGLWHKFWGNKIAGQGIFRGEDVGLLRSGSGNQEKPSKPDAQPAPDMTVDPQGPGHLQLYQHLQRKWSCYDAYARITMSMGTFWLALSLAYYEIAWNMCHLGKIFPAVVAAMMLSAIVVLLVYLDIFLSRLELAGASVLVFAGPSLLAMGAALAPGAVDATPFYAVAVDLVHVALSLWLFYLGRIIPGKETLPTRFKAVAYLDIFGPIVKELKALLDKTGLGHHAQADEEIEGDFADLFDFVDKDKSGTISREEWEEAFNAIDTNRSGTISREEWRQHHGKAAIFDVVDANGNGAVSRSEWRAAFAAFDRDGDGSISLSEWRQDAGELPFQGATDCGAQGDGDHDDARVKNARSRLQAAIVNVSGSTRRQGRALVMALQVASLVGIRSDDPDVREAEGILAQLEAPRELKRLRKIVSDWHLGEVASHLSQSQRREVSIWFARLNKTMEQLGIGPTGARQPVCRAPPPPQPASQKLKVAAMRVIGKPTVVEEKPLPTILRSLSANSTASSEYVPVWTKVKHEPGQDGAAAEAGEAYEYWAGTATEAGQWGFGDEVPADARRVEFDELRERCEAALIQAQKALDALHGTASGGGLRSAGLGERSLQRQETMASTLLLDDEDIDGNDVTDVDPETNKSKYRHGHHPVVAFRVMSLILVGIWALGALVHLVRFVEDQVAAAAERRLRPPALEEVGLESAMGASLRGAPQASHARLAWPEQFFMPRGARCLDGALVAGAPGLVVTNGFVVYSFPQGGRDFAATPAPAAEVAVPLYCPVEEHDGLVSATCAEGRCSAVVASRTGLWSCGGEEAAPDAPTPIAQVSSAYMRGRGPLEVWAAGDPDLSTVFAASRTGPIVELRQEGSALHPVAELPRPAGLPAAAEWQLLSVTEAGLLVGMLGPEPTLVAWSLATGEFAGSWPVAEGGGPWLGWCVSGGADLFGFELLRQPGGGEADLEIHRFALPASP